LSAESTSPKPFIAKVDRLPFPPIYAPFVLAGDVFRGYFVNFHETLKAEVQEKWW
jgi:hypothetical protein